MNNNNKYCIILAGGKGMRLWPCSRERYPKQFVDFFGSGRTQLQETFDRMERSVPKANIYVTTTLPYAEIVREQLPELPPTNLLIEPIHRNTAPCTALALHRISHQNADACILITPSDQAMQNEEAFRNDVSEGFDFVEHAEGVLALGVNPTRPEPGYGYIQKGKPLSEHVFEVKSFTEKPERDFAEMFVSSGEFLWNTGIYLANATQLTACFDMVLPLVLRSLDYVKPDFTTDEEDEWVKTHYPSYPNVSLEHAILEKYAKVFVMKSNFGWADLGTWHSIYEAKRKSKDDNVVIDSDVIMDNCSGNVVKIPKGRLAVISDLDGYIVAEKDNVLLICKKEDSSAMIRKYVNEVKIKRGEEFV